jgi:hypothetical protein
MQKNLGLLFAGFLLLTHFCFSQNSDSTKIASHNVGAEFVTNNGISFISIYLKFTPPFYYLKTEQQDGFYFTSALPPAYRKIPLSISSVINKVIQTKISASQNFVWNISLIYAFNKKYEEQ